MEQSQPDPLAQPPSQATSQFPDHQPLPQSSAPPMAINQHQLQPQVMMCPVQYTYEPQMLVPAEEPVQQFQNQSLLINLQNPPPWTQNRPNVVYMQQMQVPTNIQPYVPQNMVPNPMYYQYQPVMTQQDQLRQLMVNQNIMQNSQNLIHNQQNFVQNPHSFVQAQQNVVQNQQNFIQHPQSFIQNQQNYIQNPQTLVQNQQNLIQNAQNFVYNPQNFIQSPQNFVQAPQNIVHSTPNIIQSPLRFSQMEQNKQLPLLTQYMLPNQMIRKPVLNQDYIAPMQMLRPQYIRQILTVKPMSSNHTCVHHNAQKDPQNLVIPNETTVTVVPNETTETVVPNETTQTLVPNETTETVVPNETTQTLVPNETTETVVPNETTEPVVPNETQQNNDVPQHKPNQIPKGQDTKSVVKVSLKTALVRPIDTGPQLQNIAPADDDHPRVEPCTCSKPVMKTITTNTEPKTTKRKALAEQNAKAEAAYLAKRMSLNNSADKVRYQAINIGTSMNAATYTNGQMQMPVKQNEPQIEEKLLRNTVFVQARGRVNEINNARNEMENVRHVAQLESNVERKSHGGTSNSNITRIKVDNSKEAEMSAMETENIVKYNSKVTNNANEAETTKLASKHAYNDENIIPNNTGPHREELIKPQNNVLKSDNATNKEFNDSKKISSDLNISKEFGSTSECSSKPRSLIPIKIDNPIELNLKEKSENADERGSTNEKYIYIPRKRGRPRKHPIKDIICKNSAKESTLIPVKTFPKQPTQILEISTQYSKKPEHELMISKNVTNDGCDKNLNATCDATILNNSKIPIEMENSIKPNKEDTSKDGCNKIINKLSITKNTENTNEPQICKHVEIKEKKEKYVLTHVLDGHVIQESNVPFRVQKPTLSPTKTIPKNMLEGDKSFLKYTKETNIPITTNNNRKTKTHSNDVKQTAAASNERSVLENKKSNVKNKKRYFVLVNDEETTVEIRCKKKFIETLKKDIVENKKKGNTKDPDSKKAGNETKNKKANTETNSETPITETKNKKAKKTIKKNVIDTKNMRNMNETNNKSNTNESSNEIPIFETKNKQSTKKTIKTNIIDTNNMRDINETKDKTNINESTNKNVINTNNINTIEADHTRNINNSRVNATIIEEIIKGSTNKSVTDTNNRNIIEPDSKEHTIVTDIRININKSTNTNVLDNNMDSTETTSSINETNQKINDINESTNKNGIDTDNMNISETNNKININNSRVNATIIEEIIKGSTNKSVTDTNNSNIINTNNRRTINNKRVNASIIERILKGSINKSVSDTNNRNINEPTCKGHTFATDIKKFINKSTNTDAIERTINETNQKININESTNKNAIDTKNMNITETTESINETNQNININESTNKSNIDTNNMNITETTRSINETNQKINMNESTIKNAIDTNNINTAETTRSINETNQKININESTNKNAIDTKNMNITETTESINETNQNININESTNKTTIDTNNMNITETTRSINETNQKINMNESTIKNAIDTNNMNTAETTRSINETNQKININESTNKNTINTNNMNITETTRSINETNQNIKINESTNENTIDANNMNTIENNNKMTTVETNISRPTNEINNKGYNNQSTDTNFIDNYNTKTIEPDNQRESDIEMKLPVNTGITVVKEYDPFEYIDKSSVKSWTITDIYARLNHQSWRESAQKLREEEIDGESLLLVSKEQLLQIGISEKHAQVITEFVEKM